MGTTNPQPAAVRCEHGSTEGPDNRCCMPPPPPCSPTAPFARAAGFMYPEPKYQSAQSLAHGAIRR